MWRLADGIKNGDEVHADVGGSCGTSCSDKHKNGDETGVDCGGSCKAKKCSTCSDGRKDGDEVGIDCGGSCATPCAKCSTFKCGDKQVNDEAVFCAKKTCSASDAAACCLDRQQCGMALALKCPTGTVKVFKYDDKQKAKHCAHVSCTTDECCMTTPKCDDGRKNGDEEKADCGGSCKPCPTCSDGTFQCPKRPSFRAPGSGQYFRAVKLSCKCMMRPRLLRTMPKRERQTRQNGRTQLTLNDACLLGSVLQGSRTETRRRPTAAARARRARRAQTVRANVPTAPHL